MASRTPARLPGRTLTPRTSATPARASGRRNAMPARLSGDRDPDDHRWTPGRNTNTTPAQLSGDRDREDRRWVDNTRVGPARLFAVLMGIVYLVVAVAEVVLGLMGSEIMLGGMSLLMFAPVHNIIHWVTGLALLGVLAFGRWPTKLAARTVGFVFAVVFLLGLLAPDLTGMLLGHEGSLPLAYSIIHATTGALGLLAGFMSHAQPYMVRHGHHRLA